MSDSFAVFVLRRAFAVVAVAAITFLMLRLLAPWGFDPEQPALAGLWQYLGDVFLHGDLGVSRQRPFLPVSRMLSEGLAADVELLIGSILCGLGLGLYGGVVCV